MRSEVTVDVVEGQILTASGLLQWIEAEADKTRRAIGVSPLLGALTYLLGSIIRKIEQIGIDQFDPEHAGFAASKFIEVSESVRVMIAHSETNGLYDRFPLRRILKRIQIQGKQLKSMATTLQLLDEKWQSKIAQAAQERIELSRQIAIVTPEEPIILFDSPDDSSEGPSEEAIKAQFHRAVATHHR